MTSKMSFFLGFDTVKSRYWIAVLKETPVWSRVDCVNLRGDLRSPIVKCPETIGLKPPSLVVSEKSGEFLIVLNMVCFRVPDATGEIEKGYVSTSSGRFGSLVI